MNTRQETKLQKIPPPLFRLIVVWFACPLRMVSSSVRSRQRTKLAAVDCCVLGQDRPWFASSMPPNFRTILLCLSPLPPPKQLIVTSPGRPPPSRLFIKSIRAGLGPIVLLVPPPEHILCWRAAGTCHRPIFVLPWGLFHQPHSKIDGLDGFGGEGRHQRWCWMALVAIARWFGGYRTWFRSGRSMVDGCFCCAVREKVRYLVRTLTKKWRSAQLTFFNRSLSDLDVSFVNKYQYLICRARSALSKTVLTLI
jgi:hypothetical protein